MNRAILASLFTLSLAALAATAAELDYPKQVFDAVYTSQDPKTGSHTMRMISDGKGHMRMETNANGMKSASIMDYPNKVCTTLMETQKMAVKMPLSTSKGQITDEASAKKENAKSLGQKTIDGHPCHGYEHSEANSTSRVWIGDDIHYMVRSEAVTPNGTMVMDLKSWSTAAPSADLFVVPAGYKEMKMPIGSN